MEIVIGASTSTPSALGGTTVFTSQATMSAGKNPNQLNFSIVGYQPQVDPFSDERFLFANDDFFDTNSPSAYKSVTASGTAATVTGANSRLVFTQGASSGWTMLFSRSRMRFPYMYVRGRIDTLNGTATPGIGFGLDANNFMYLYVDRSTRALTLVQKQAGSFGVNAVGPVVTAGTEFMLVICHPEIWGYVKTADGWRPFGYKMITNLDLRTDSVRAGWSAFMASDNLANDVASFSSFSVGVIGGVGSRDYKPITYLDGTPFTSNGKYYVSATMATGNDFQTNHMAIMSIDPNTFQAKIESHLFFRIASGTITTSLYGGTILYDSVNDKWIIITNGWGYGNASTGVGLWYAECQSDILSGVQILDANTLSVPTTTSVYDCAVRYDNGTWKVAMAETTTATNWSSYYPTYWKGATLDTLTKQASDTSRLGEGQQWAKIGGLWYIISASGDGWHYYSDTLVHQGILTTWMNFGTAPIAPSGYWSHPCVIPINDGGNTRYILLGFDDNNFISGNATKGRLFVMEAAEIVAGNEHPLRRVARPSR